MAKSNNFKIGVYGIHNTTSNKWYIGSSTDIEGRLNTHISSIKKKSGIFENINGGDDFEYKILKIVASSDSLELWENYFIGLNDSINSGYNRKLASRRPTLVIYKYESNNSEIKIMDDTDLALLLKIDDEKDLLSLKERIPHLIITKGTKRYIENTVINFLLRDSEISIRSKQIESEVTEYFYPKKENK